jgi:hypothetical protein
VIALIAYGNGIVFGLAAVSHSGKRSWYALRIVRPVERESGFAKQS